MTIDIETRLESALGRRPAKVRSLQGGCVARVYRVDFGDRERLVAKVDSGPSANLGIEAMMLRYLKAKTDFPVPEVIYGADDLLVMEFVDNDGVSSTGGEKQAAELLAGLHAHGAEVYGFECDTLIGPLRQPNPKRASWTDFFAQERLVYMGRQCVEAGRMDGATLDAIEVLCGRLDEYLVPGRPALIHGDLWGGNVLYRRGRIAAFIDPALYFADPEIELAFTTLFTTFGKAFYDRYDAIRPIAPGFFEVRKDLYNLYPLLVHVRLFGGSYLDTVQRMLRRY